MSIAASLLPSLEAIEGPFYLPNAPHLEKPYVLPQRCDEAGAVLFFRGSITSSDGTPLVGAELDRWHAMPRAFTRTFILIFRSGICAAASIPVTTELSRFARLFPPPYEIAKCGPTGIVLKTLGRHFFRPAHLHLKVTHPQYRSLTSQVYFDGGTYLNSDVANAVREGLVAKLVRRKDPSDLAARDLDKPYFEILLNFILVPHDVKGAL